MPGSTKTPDEPDDKDRRLAALVLELQQERQRTAHALKRAELLEESCKRAYRMALSGRRDRPPDDAA